MSDFRYALRLLTRTPGITIAAVLSLALGIGANTAIFSVADALMFRSLPVRDPARLILVEGSLQYSTFARVQSGTAAGDLAAIVRSDRYNVVTRAASGGPPELDGGPVRVSLVSGNYFTAMAVDASRGRALQSADDVANARPVVVITDAYWKRRFGGADDVLGRRIEFGDLSCEIVGVAPASFTGEWIGRPVDVWLPIVWQPRVMLEIPVPLQNVAVTAMGRLRDGVSLPQAQAMWEAIAHAVRTEEAGPNPTPEQRASIDRDQLEISAAPRGFSPQRLAVASSLGILMGAVGAVLLIACANIANLLLARSESRRREMAVRYAVGATRGRLIRQVLSEGVLLAVLGGAAGLVVASAAAASLLAFVRSGPATTAGSITAIDLAVPMDFRVFVFTALLCGVTGVLVALIPAMRASRLAMSPALIGRGVVGTGAGGRLSIGRVLVIAQVALSLLLLVGAGLLARTLRNLTGQDLGFARDHMLLIWALPGQTGGRGVGAADFWHEAIARVAAIPGVVSASASNQGVLNGTNLGSLGTGPGLRIEGEPQAPAGLPGLRSFVAPGFFQTMGIRIIAGREFAETDTASAPRGVVIAQAMAKHYFGDRNPIGRRIWFPEDTAEPTTVIGVADDVIVGGPRETARRPGYTYFSYRDREAARRLRTMMMAVRASSDPASLVGPIRSTIQQSGLRLPILKIETVDEQIADVLVQDRLVSAVANVFGLLSLLLAAIGLNGVISYAVARRTNEIGIRMALGASRRGILRATLGDSLMLVAIGVVIGVPAALGVARLLEARLFGVGSSDAIVLGGAVAIMIAVTAVAAFLPARRASSIDPLVALRE